MKELDAPVWEPKSPEKTAMFQMMRMVEKKYHLTLPDYAAFHAWSIQFPALFWQELAAYYALTFKTLPAEILHTAEHMMQTQWFTGATFNITEQLLKRQDNHSAFICIDETNQRRELSYQALHEQVQQCAASLYAKGVRPNDRVSGLLTNSEYAVIAMLATAAIGAIWSACSPDFGVNALTDRFTQIEPKVLFVCDGYHYHGKAYDLTEKTEALLEKVSSIEHVIICPTTPKAAHMPQLKTRKTISVSAWSEHLAHHAPKAPMPAFAFNHPWYILFSSGTTGQPKCIVHSTGGTLLQHLKELGLHTDLTAQDKLFFHTTCGWMMWNWMVSALALGTTLVLYDGSPLYPETESLFEHIAKEEVSVFGTGARFLAAVQKRETNLNQMLNFEKLRTILSTGSPLLPEQYDFVRERINQDTQLSSISGGTDIVSCFALGNPITPVYRGELQSLGLGMAVEVFNEQGASVTEEPGELVCTQPFPSMPLGFWGDNQQQKYYQAYFNQYSNVWAHGDMAECTAHGGLIIYGRSDAILNPGGVRIGTAEIYRPLELLPEIQDSIVIGQPWDGDVRIVLFVKLAQGTQLDSRLKALIRRTIREASSPRHVPAKILEVPDIPKTINGKLVEVAVRQTVQGEPVHNLDAIANPDALEYFKNRAELAPNTTEKA